MAKVHWLQHIALQRKRCLFFQGIFKTLINNSERPVDALALILEKGVCGNVYYEKLYGQWKKVSHSLTH